MKFRRNKKDFFEFENDRKTHVKLYKAGKQWVSSLISSIGLIRVFKGKLDKSTMNTQLVSKEKDKKSEDKLSSDGITAALKGAAALGAVAGGTVLTTNTALADTKQLDSNQNLVNNEIVNLSSGSGSSSVSDSLSTSESNVQTESSVSKSESVSLNTNSSSTSETRSDSNSRSESISESKSDSNSQSVSSQTTSKSESLASTSLENSQTTTGTTAKDKLQGLINQATDFVNSDAFKSSSSDFKPALAAAVKQYATVMQSSTSLTEQDYQYGINGLTLLMNKIKTPSSSIEPNIFMANAQTNSSLGTPDTNTESGDTPAYWGSNGNDKYKWIPGDTNNRLWWDVNAYTSRDTHQTIGVAKNNVEVKKEDLGGGKTQWTITFYPEQGVSYDADKKTTNYGLVHAQMGFYLTKDYKINRDVNIRISLRSGTTYYYKDLDFPLGTGLKVRTSANDPASGDVNPEADITFKPGDVNKTNGVISDTPNKFYQFGRYADIWNMPDTFDKSVFSGRVSDTNDKIGNAFAFNNELDKAKALAGQTSKDMVVNKAPFTTSENTIGSFNKNTIGTAMYLQSWGDTTRTMAASYTVTFTTLHSNAAQADLAAGNYNGAFSGVYAIANTYQNTIDIYHLGWGAYPTLQGQLVGQEVYNLKIDDKGGTIDSTLPSKLTSESTSESESESKSSSESESKSSSESVSTSQSQSESKSASTSSSMSESLSTSSSLSESLSTSSSLSESLSTSSSLSESLSASSSLSESLSTSSSLSESLSTSSSLSESLSTSSSLSESLSTSSSLSESLSTSSSLSESLSISSSLSESLSTSSSLSESLSTSSSLSESLSTSSSLSESLSTSSSLSESLSTSSSLSESLSTSSSLSESLSTSSSLSESLSTSSSLSESLSTSSSLSESLSTSSSLSESLSTSSSLSESLSTSSSLSESLSTSSSLSESLSTSSSLKI